MANIWFIQSYYGGTEEDFVRSIAIDSQNNLYAAGYTHSTDFPIKNAAQTNYGVHL